MPKLETKKPTDDKKKEAPADGGWRETVESIAMAVILALLFRGFVAEAFVIPTGSMAPTLQGRHKDVECPKCHAQYQTSGSDEEIEGRLSGMHVFTTSCPICRYTRTLDPLNRPNDGSFSGDRIIVGKFCYDLAEPKRWDVIVFKYPGNGTLNYIKRLIGLPGETIGIAGGNIYANKAGEQPRIARKPPHKLEAMLQIVDDTGHIPQELIDIGWPSRWQNWPAAGAWDVQEGGRRIVCKGDGQDEAWVRYRHLVPGFDDWRTIELDKKLPDGVAQRPGMLISDYYAYNTAVSGYSDVVPAWTNRMLGKDWRAYWWNPLYRGYPTPTEIPQQPGPGMPPRAEAFGQHWVDDLAVECLAEVTGQAGELSLLLVRGGVKHVCRINLADGKATLSMTDFDGAAIDFVGDDGKTAAAQTAQTRVKAPGRYRLRLANCDHEMLLWVNGSVVKFDGPTTYDTEELVHPYWSAQEPGDMAPAGIGSKGAAVTLSDLKIFRDKYYIATRPYNDLGHADDNDYEPAIRVPLSNAGDEAERIQEVFADPQLWETSNVFLEGGKDTRRYVQFALEKDQFLPLGDNSPHSSDGRFWFGTSRPHHYVERDLLIGKALVIYWPHTWNRPVPLTPNFRKMGRIR